MYLQACVPARVRVRKAVGLQVLDLIHELEHEWTGPDYSLLTKNCCHFSEYLCEKLGAAPVPPWVNR